MAKHPISKKLLKQLPAVVAEQLDAIGRRYHIHSFTYEQRERYTLCTGEGDRYTVVYKGEVSSVEMVAEHNLGTKGLNHQIGAQIPMPVGCVVFEVGYLGGFYLHVVNVSGTDDMTVMGTEQAAQPALPAVDPYARNAEPRRYLEA